MSLYERGEAAVADALFEHHQQHKIKKQMLIQIVTTSVETKPTAKGSYQQMEVVYKNLSIQGKIESKKLMSFGAGAPTFKVLGTAEAGQQYEISVVKNQAGYNDWISASVATADTPAPVASAAPAFAGKATASPKSTYETPEERAQRQILIVRQSSLSCAVNMLAANTKHPLKVEEVVNVAKQFENYVFGIKDPGPTGFDDLPALDEALVD